MKYGLYNSYRLAIAPNQSTGYLMNATPSLTPVSKVVEVREYGTSKTIYPMPYLDNENNDKINSKHYSQDDYNTNNNKESIINDDDIKEEILIETLSQEREDPNNDKEKSSSLHNYTSSQTFGYDNSVTSYNLDFYDYVEDVER